LRVSGLFFRIRNFPREKKKKMKIFVVVCLIALAFACAADAQDQGSWTVVKSNFAKIAMSLNYSSPTDGIIAASTESGAPEFLKTSDGGSTLSASSYDAAGFFFAVRLSPASSSGTGVAAGLGLLGSPCVATSQDGGNSWAASESKYLFCSSQSVAVATSDKNTLVVAGQWTSPAIGSGDGVHVSSDGGATFQPRSWLMDVNATSRYVAAPTDEVFYVTGGTWPTDDEDQIERRRRDTSKMAHVSRNVRVHLGGSASFDFSDAAERKRGEAAPPTNGYVGVLAATDDAGKSWTTLINLRDEGVYFNAVSCSSKLNCTAVAEGVDSSGDAAVYAFSTTTGFKSFNKVRLPVFSALAVSMLDDSYGWIGGIVPNSARRPQGAFLQTTDGGQTWTQVGPLLNGMAVMDIQTLSRDSAVAVGSNSFGLPVLAAFTN
jgi:photosystem II stability/assembly factor-like uncharacterized protein